MTSVVYKLIFANGDFYIGVTNNLKRRCYEHNMKEHTKGFIDVEVLYKDLTQEEAYIIEKSLVPDHNDRSPKMRNKTRGGRHPFNMRTGRTHTKETKEKISKTKKGKKINFTIDYIKKLKARMISDNPSKRESVRKKLSEQSRLNNKRRGNPGTMLGKKLSMESLSKISYTIIIEGVEFASSVRAAKHFNCSQQTVINRCKSDKFPDWNIIHKGKKYT